MRRVGWLTLLLLAAAVAAQPPTLTTLGPTEGLSGLSVTALAPDGRGQMALGLDGGVDLFDGARIRPAPLAETDGYVYAFATDASGALWAGSADGLWWRPPGATAFRRVPVGSTEAPEVRALAAGGGALWVGTVGDGLLRIAGGRVRRYTRARGGLAADTVRALVARTTGEVVAATSGGITRIGPDGRVRHDRSVRDVTALAEVDGRVWAARVGEVVRLGERTDPPDRRVPGPGLPVSALVPSAAHPGRMWVGYRGGGVRALDTRAGALGPPPALPDVALARTEVLSLAEHGGALWIGTTRGVDFGDLTPPRFHSIRGTPDGPLAVPDVMSVHASRRTPGVVWAGTVQGGLHRIDRAAGRAERWFDDASHPLSVVFAIHEGADGDVWLGGQGATLWRFRPGTGRADAFPLAPGRGGIVTRLAPSAWAEGHLWVTTTEAGLVRFDTRARRVVARYDTVPGGVPAADVWEVAETPDALWVATDGDGLWRLDRAEGRAARIKPACDPGDALVSLATAPDGALWIGSKDATLTRLDRATGACHTFATRDGLPDETLGALAIDARGRVWIGTNAGLFRLDPASTTVTAFTAADGLPSAQLYWHARDQSPTGDVAFGGAGGLTVFDPLRVLVDETSQPVALTGLRVNGEARPVVPGTPVALALSHRENDVAFEVAGLDLRQPGKTRYRVRLRGASDVWEAAGTETRYRALGPGRYTFEVQATNRDGYWSAPLAVPLQIRPPFWRTVPFWLLVLGAFGGLGYGAHRYRIAQIERVEQTRRRIADDLHDGIGSKISSVALRLDMVGRRDALPAATRETLAGLAGTARAVVDDLRDTVWLVDAAHDDLASVVARMELFAVTTLDGRGSVVAPEAPPARPLPMEVRRDLYLLFTEAIHNAVRHAGGSAVDVRIEAEGARVGFEVADGGSGFDPEAVSAGRGLSTMRQRAAALGGTLVWERRPAGGTVVRFRADLG